MEPESLAQPRRWSDAEKQLDLTATVSLLHETVNLTNLIVQGPTAPDEESWLTQAATQWRRTICALKKLFRTRCDNVDLTYSEAEHDRLSRQCLETILNMSRAQPRETAWRVGRTIQSFIHCLHENLEDKHAWHDAQSKVCRCCRSNVLQYLQESIVYQMQDLESVIIPWQNYQQ